MAAPSPGLYPFSRVNRLEVDERQAGKLAEIGCGKWGGLPGGATATKSAGSGKYWERTLTGPALDLAGC
jgi:hypothetical protein